MTPDHDPDYQKMIKDIQHTRWLYPDGIHTRYELRILEPDSRNYSSPCPCGCGEQLPEEP